MTTTITTLGDGDVWPLLKRLVSRKRRAAAEVAVPYVSAADLLDLRDGDTLVCDLSDATLGAGLTNPAVLLKYAKRGVEVFHCPGLHAKIYLLGSTAVVGSPNMSASSEHTLREAITVTNEPIAVRQARDLVATFAMIRYDRAALAAAQAKYRPPKRPPGGRSAPDRPPEARWAWSPPTTADRTWIVRVADVGWPEKAQRVAAAHKRDMRRRSGPASSVELAAVLINADGTARMREGDVVYEIFWFNNAGAEVADVFSARFVHAVPVPGTVDGERVVVAWSQLPRNETSVRLEDFTDAAREVGFRVGTEVDGIPHEVRSRPAKSAFIDLWKRSDLLKVTGSTSATRS